MTGDQELRAALREAGLPAVLAPLGIWVVNLFTKWCL